MFSYAAGSRAWPNPAPSGYFVDGSSTTERSDTLSGQDPSSGKPKDAWADAIASATAHVETETPERPPRRGPGKIVLTLAGILITVGVAAGVVGVRESKPVALAPSDQAADLRVEAAALIEQIEAYRRERGTLPDPRVLVPYLDEGYEYHVINEEQGLYVVSRTAGGVTVTYDGSLPVGLWILLGGGAGGPS